MARLVYEKALAAVEELAFLASQSRESHARIVEMLDEGTGLFDIEIDRTATMAAGEDVMVYKPSDRLLGILAANRAPDRQVDDI